MYAVFAELSTGMPDPFVLPVKAMYHEFAASGQFDG
jgi:hypothetical protein